MAFEGKLAGFEERFMDMINLLCLVIGGVFTLFALASIMMSPSLALSYAGLGIAFLMFPLAAAQVFRGEEFSQAPPALLKASLPKPKK